MAMNSMRRHQWGVSWGLLGWFLPALVWAGNGSLEIRNGYFWDPLTADYFLARGMAYQTFNPPVGANQSIEQLRYDLNEFKKMHCNSVRCEMVWSQVEPEAGVYDWERPDALVRLAEELGLKLFVLIGFQYPPFWFPDEWRATDERGGKSEMLIYEHPEARRIYERYIREVTGRYRHSTAIGGWILGNEYAYFDLWTADHLFVGYDPVSFAAFRRFLRNEYAEDIRALNASWGRAYLDFDAVEMPAAYPPDRQSGAYHDLIRWRERSIGDFVAVGAVAARAADPNHLISYSMIGGLFIGNDAIYTCEDARTIVTACTQAGAPLDFWSINNYAWASFVGEMRTGDFGIRKHAFDSGLPVMISETGHTATDQGLIGSGPRQGDAIVTQMWEALMSGAVGTHLFTWQEREMFFGSPVFEREMGFGVVYQNRKPQSPGYRNLVSMFRTMEGLRIERLFGGSRGPDPRLWFFWGNAAKMGWPRANVENAMIWNTLKRLGYQPGIFFDAEFERGDYSDRAEALILSRALQMAPGHLDRIASDVLPRGIHLFANADLPGRYDAYHRPQPTWPAAMQTLFGLDAGGATAWDSGARSTTYRPLELTVVSPLEPLAPGFRDTVNTWRIWEGITPVAGTTVATHRGPNQLAAPLPALQLHSLGPGRTAAATFGLADNWNSNDPSPHAWHHRYRWLKAIFGSHFGLAPPLELSGPGASYVIPDYRYSPDGSLLISLLNGHTNRAEVNLSAPALLAGLTVEDLTRGGILEPLSGGVVALSLRGDEFVLLHAYVRDSEGDRSPVNPNPNKLWFREAPRAVWPSARPAVLEVGFDTVEPLELLTVFERTSFPPGLVASSPAVTVSGQATHAFELRVPEVDLGNIHYRSSPEGGRYQWRAILQRQGRELASVALPIRLLWGVSPLAHPPRSVQAGVRYPVTLKWEELPAYEPEEAGLPLNRAAMWEQTLIGWQHYLVMLEMLDPAGDRLAIGWHLTRQGSGSATLEVVAPVDYAGPVQWRAYPRPKPQASFDHFDSFENRGPGANPKWLSPWVPYVYSEHQTAEYYDSGIGRDGWAAPQYGFVVVTNPPTAGAWSGFGLGWSWPYEVGLPEDTASWTNIAFSARFRELQGLPCILELQLNDALGGQLQFARPYEPGPDGWGEIRATLDQFEITPYEPFNGAFNLARVSGMAVNVRMLEASQTYVGFFDDVHLNGPEDDRPPVTGMGVRDSFENRSLGDDPDLTAPWYGYVYSESGQSQFIAQGVQPDNRHGWKSAFLAATNAVNPGAYAGMGFYYVFPEPWSLGSDGAQPSQYSFGFHFREANRRPCRIELQVKSSPGSWIEYSKEYQPGPDGWDTVEAWLHEFTLPSGVGGFDPRHIEALAVNVQFLAPAALYEGSFDRIRFEGPETLAEPDLNWGMYRSEMGSGIDADQDGVLDIHETGTGVYRGPTDTGTSPELADSDGDGLLDGEELLAGTDPNDPADFLSIDGVDRLSESDVRLRWQSHAGRRYTVFAADIRSLSEGNFWAVPGLTRLLATTNGPMEGVVRLPPDQSASYFRLAVVSVE